MQLGFLRRFGRLFIGVIAVVLIQTAGTSAASAATASPIDAKYQALGGASSVLGAPTGPEHAVAGGRERDYKNGAILFSNATGAHEVHGNIATTFVTLGGAGEVGFPTADERATTASGGRISSFQKGAGSTQVKAAILWSSGTGAHIVRGAILQRYLQMGGPGVAGFPTSDEYHTAPRTGLDGYWSVFQKGDIFWSAPTGARWVVNGPLLDTFLGPCGYFCYGMPTSDVLGGAHGSQVLKTQYGGAIYWSPAYGVHTVSSEIVGKYNSLGGTRSSLGLPKSDTLSTVDGLGLFVQFEHGKLQWDSITGIVSVINS